MMKTSVRARKSKRLVRAVCAACAQRPCACLSDWTLLKDGAELVERAARGAATSAELAALADRHRQRDDEKAELRKGYKFLRRTAGRSAARALWGLFGGYGYAITGSDEEVQHALRTNMVRVGVGDIALARAYVARCWLRRRPPMRKTRANVDRARAFPRLQAVG